MIECIEVIEYEGGEAENKNVFSQSAGKVWL
jgi:hypothetical protein